MLPELTPEQKEKDLRTIERIEFMARPEKWREIRKFMLAKHPEWVLEDKLFMQSCKELRQRSESKTGASKSLDIRNTVKIPSYVYRGLLLLDPEVREEMSGRNHGLQIKLSEELYKAFPMYRIARRW